MRIFWRPYSTNWTGLYLGPGTLCSGISLSWSMPLCLFRLFLFYFAGLRLNSIDSQYTVSAQEYMVLRHTPNRPSIGPSRSFRSPVSRASVPSCCLVAGFNIMPWSYGTGASWILSFLPSYRLESWLLAKSTIATWRHILLGGRRGTSS